jgi:dTDP-4-amino-4,6-dideoxygalactose transaminase
MSRDALYEALKKYNIFSRRYFYPLLCDFPCYRAIAFKDPLLTARRVSERILCLPIYADLAIEDVVRICESIAFLQKQSRLAAVR